ncbi:TPA: DUF1642 domain-containing protein [Streptococcus suis]|nr:DUF1642 domain-containing protein [Streptococcus suis]
MNKQEAIKKLKAESWEYEDNFCRVVHVIDLDVAQKILSQIHEPQKFVVPKVVATWIEHCKQSNLDLDNAMRYTRVNNAETGVEEWIYENQETFARAWLDGYTIKQEQLYTAELFNGQPLVEVNNVLYFSSDLAASNAHVSKDKLEAAGFGWVFDCNGVKVVEVE